ncbi:MAG: GGDEF domain-containing protein [Burkholderiales bacterium]
MMKPYRVNHAGPSVTAHRLVAALRSMLLALLLPCALATAADAANSTRILALENLGRARPDEAAAALENMLPLTAEHGTERLELLTVQGVMLTLASMNDAAEAAVGRLTVWSEDTAAAHASAAGAAAALIRTGTMVNNGDLQRADEALQTALMHLPDTTAPRDRYRFVAALARIKRDSGKLDAAVQLSHEALALAERTDEPWRQAEARVALASSYTGAQEFERAHRLTKESLALAENASDWIGLSRGYNTLGIVLDGLGDQPGQRHSFEQAIHYARRAGSKIDEVLLLANMADFFLKTGDYATALTHAERALPLARELKDRSSETVALSNIGLSHISLQHLELGKRYVAEAMAIDQRRGAATDVADMYGELGVYLEKAGDLRGSVSAYHVYRRMMTGLLPGQQQKAILAMQEQYDADSRKRSLVLLARENEIKAEKLRRRDLQQRLWGLVAAAFALSLTAIALLHYRVRRTNRLLATSNGLLEVQGERDPLTGLGNRRRFDAAMRELAADGTLNGTAYLVDIDHFKRINDRHGHRVGDAVLVEVAQRLRATLRDQDLLVRWGGEEFLAVVQSLGTEQADALAQRMLCELEGAAISVDSHHITATASIGFATFPIGPTSLRVPEERAIALVDAAMYLAKAHGRNRAYGVRLLQACDAPALATIANALESAWRKCIVDLTLLQGRSPLAMAA